VRKTALILVGAFIFGLGGISAASAGLWEEATAASQRGNYAAAIKILRRLADGGDTRAQASLGIMYEEGKGVPQNYSEAVNWYRRSATKGDATGQYDLGLMYVEGKRAGPGNLHRTISGISA
jgi:uncharacterized protein